jgi:hypothetical protein
MLVGTFAFANTSDSSIDLNKIESLIHVENLELAADEAASDCGFPVFYSDGTDGSGDWGGSRVDYYLFSCGQSTSMVDLVNWLNTNYPFFESAIIKCRK